MELKHSQIPMAYTLIAAAERVRPRRDGRHPVEKYFLLWTAFNVICSTIAEQKGYQTELVLDEDAAVVTRQNGSVEIPEVKTVSETKQLHAALDAFDDDLKNNLITHDSTAFFVERSPFWQGKRIESDGFGQSLNGVIDVRKTINAKYPVWSPLDVAVYNRYLEGLHNPEDRNFLARQLLDLLFTMGRNLMQVSNVFDDAKDIAVYEKGLPLLAMIMSSFTD